MTDANEITHALRLWFQAGDVFEVRVLDAVSADYRREHIESGYFDYEHISAVPEALKRLLSFRGVYVTVNPVNPDLLARAVNRLRPAGRNPTTADTDIVRRRWLLIDCDPRRASGVSSSNAEHESALAKAREIRDGLSSLGWPDPIMTDSGNGAQLMYRIDLPADDGELVRRVIGEIAKASSEQVAIDTSVHNPARIWRLPGTMNCKGDSIPERPHRMARILDEPQDIVSVSREQMQDIVSYQSEDTQTDVPDDDWKHTMPAFDLDSWIAQYCPELGSPQPWKGGRKWIFPVCPFNEAHTNKSAVLIQEPSGAVAFKCHHNGCSGNDWRALRELREPGCYDRREEANSDVDLSGILKPNRIEKQEKEAPLFPNPGPVPDKLLSIPGFIDDVVKLSMQSAPYPNRVLSFTGALALLAFLVGRKVQDKRDNRSNIYLIALADSGTGKDHPRKVNFNIAFRAGVAGAIGDAFASGEGLEDALFMHPSMLFQADEFDCIFNTLKYSKDNRAESINEKLLKFYGASNTIYPLRKKASAKKKDGTVHEIAHIVNPNLVLLGTAIPQYFYESLSRRVLENGLVARCIIVEAGKRGEAGNPQPITPSDSLIRAATYLANLDVNGNLTNEYPKPLIITETPEATAALREVQQECDRRYNFYEAQNEGAAKALWARAHEKVCKLAMLHGISGNVYNPLITEKSVRWAWKFIDHLTQRMLYMADRYVYENIFDEKCQRAIRKLQEHGGRLPHSKLLRLLHESADSMKKIAETLQEKGTVQVEYDSSVRPAAKIYRLVE
ncbi:DUF3987 domain-containing protein [Victivallaceae bacterium BBE-744-WT-12]|uniref:DUF3987 domain-containing protein n=1 Tax=Victivallis lenta TaxID=2606640 RepID=A0A844GAM4_9BACT|nr:hypothetical protein [Victivallis lenta]MST99571.1 DUF3987 domain-containing protein [Victivallis lenta]